MNRTIKVTGKGRMSVRPDTTRIVLGLEGTEKEYGDALLKSSEKTNDLKSTLEAFGFTRQDLKTLNFGVNAVYESYQDKDQNWKQRMVGYRFDHRLKVEFPSDNDRLGKILYALGHSEAKPEIRIEYTVEDKEAVKKELLKKAVADSRGKAKLLVKAAGVKLGEILNIDYSFGELDLVSRPMNDGIMMAKAYGRAADMEESLSLDIEANDIEVTDTVTVVWALLD